MKKRFLLFLLTFVNYCLVLGQNPIKNLKSPASITACAVSVATPATNSLCATNPVVLTASGSIFYQWQKNDVDIPGANGSNYPATTPGMYKTYAVESVWTAQTTGITTILKSVFFVDKLKGWAAGAGGVILATTDGGATWTPQNSTVTADLNGIAFINATTGIALGNSGTIVRTTNGGTTWATVNSSTTSRLTRISFVDANTAMVGGSNSGTSGSRIIKTSDGGQTWVIVFQGGVRGSVIYAIDMISTSTTLALELFDESINTLVKSIDGGANWTESSAPLKPDLLSGVLYDLEMQSASIGYAVGQGGNIGKTINGGNSWLGLLNNMPPNTNTNDLTGVTFPSPNLGWVVGGTTSGSNKLGVIFSTTSAGNTWNTETVAGSKKLWDVFFVDNENGWAVGENGEIYKHSFNKLCVSNTIEIVQGTGNNSMIISGATNICMGASNTLTASGCT